MLWDAQQNGLGNTAVRGKHIPDFCISQKPDPTETEGNASWVFLWVILVLPWGGAPQTPTFPSYANVLNLTFHPGPSSLVTVPDNCLETAC